ncbi:MAG: hypothetical protein CSA97_03230 [Bacteroidetes bacterium]|nr:MAG: hypothetical protein CSA97_03230 [Bacteroidota bacterium]
MAIITPVRPKWMRRDGVVVYVAKRQMRARSRAASIRNPRTESQQSNRSKFGVATAFLRQLQAMVAVGFQPEYTQRNGRRVGAFHVALGELLRKGMRQGGADGRTWMIDYPKVKLSQGKSLAAYPLEAHRSGGELQMQFPKGLPRGAARVRVAVHCPRAGATCHFTVPAPRPGEAVAITLPKWAQRGDIHVFYMLDPAGRSAWSSGYAFVPKGRGGRSAGGRFAAPEPSAGVAVAAERAISPGVGGADRHCSGKAGGG